MGLLPPAELPFIESWTFFGSPMPMLTVFFVYFYAITYGPAYMKTRQPYKLTNIIRVYNLFQIISCITFSLLAHFGWGYNVFKTTWKCVKYDDYIETADDLVYIYTIYWYFLLLRMSELIETIFFVLRKKQNQVSFLHVYHHVSTIVFLYLLNRYSASPMETHVAILNNNVHILMYTYYFLSSFENLSKYVSKFKPIMTTIQIVQLLIILGQCFVARMCGSSAVFYIMSFNIAILIGFFGKFYYTNYINSIRMAKKKE